MDKEINIDYTPTKYQLDLHQSLKEHGRDTIHCVKALRQIGKSICLEMILLKNAIEKPMTNNYEVSPTNNQAAKLYQDIKSAIASSPILKKSNETKLTLTLWNGSTIRFFSAEAGDNLRGYTCDLLAVDEAAYIADNIFYSCILAWTNVKKAPIIMVSTPRFKSGFFYKYYSLGMTTGKSSRYFSYDWAKYDTSQFLTDEKKEEYRMQLPRQVYMSEVMGEWLDMEGSVFGSFEHCIGNEKEKRNPSDLHYMGIDWGSGQGGDDTAIAIFNQNREMKALYHFNDKDETETIRFICAKIKEWKPLKVQVETNSIGAIFMGLLRKEMEAENIANDTMLLGFNTTNDSKTRLVNSLQVSFQNSTVKLLNDAALITQLSVYEGKPSRTGKMTYNAPSGYHDDTIIATMLALDCISKGGTDVFFL